MIVEANYSGWHGHSLGWHVEPVRHKPKLPFEFDGIGFVKCSTENDGRLIDFHGCSCAFAISLVHVSVKTLASYFKFVKQFIKGGFAITIAGGPARAT